MKIFRKLCCALSFAFVFCAMSAIAQNAPTNAAQFQVSLNFLGGTPYGQSSALSSAFTAQFTTNTQLRADIITMPGAGYEGFFGGPQYNLCGLTPLEALLSSTSLNCGKFGPYMNGAIGLGRVQQGSNPVHDSLAGLLRAGANYDVTGSGTFTVNLFECGWGSFGVGARSAVYCQTGFSLGIGSNAAATQAKTARMRRSQAKKLKKLQAAIAKANRS